MIPRPHKTLIFISLIWLTITNTHNLYALTEDRDQPIHITSKSFKHDGKTGKTIYSGDVHLTQGSIKLAAEHITMLSTPDGDLISIVAEGNPANFEQKPKVEKAKVIGNAKTITYSSKLNSITLVGNAHIQQGEQMRMTSEFIEYLADTDQVKANTSSDINNNASRVNIIIPPNNKH